MAEKKGFFGEFKAFIMRGNVVDMAIGIIIGSAFTAIVNSFVNDIINPVIGLLIGKVDFTELRVILIAATEDASEVAIRYGNLIQAIVKFLLTAFVLFFIVRFMNKMRELQAKKEAEAKAAEEAKKAPEPAPEPVIPADIALLTEIRYLLKKN